MQSAGQPTNQLRPTQPTGEITLSYPNKGVYRSSITLTKQSNNKDQP